LRALGCDQIARGKRRLRARGAVGQDAGDGARLLAERRQFGIEAQHSRACRFGKPANDRLEIILCAEAIPDRRHGHVLGGGAAGYPALDLPAGQRFGPDDRSQPAFLQPRLPDRGIDAALPEDFHGARVDAARFRRDRGARVSFDQQRTHAVLREQQRGR